MPPTKNPVIDPQLFEAEILRQYESAFEFSDAVIALDSNQKIICWSKGAESQFKYAARAAIGQELNLIFSDFLVFQDLIDSEYTKNQALYAQGILLGQGKRVAHGELLKAKTARDSEILVKCSIYPLAVDAVLYLVLFFAVEAAHSSEDNAIASTHSDSPFSPNQNNPFIFGAQWVLLLWKTQPGLLVLVILVGFLGLGIWRAESLGKAYKDVRAEQKPTESAKLPETFNMPAKKSAALQVSLNEFRNTLPKPNEARVFVGIYSEEEGTLFAVLPIGGQSSDGQKPMVSGRYKVVIGNMMDRFERHRDDNCFVLETPKDLNDPLEKRLLQRFSAFHLSCGFPLPLKHSNDPHYAFLAVEGIDPKTDLAKITELIKAWSPKVQEILGQD
jgi:hypothetical protein